MKNKIIKIVFCLIIFCALAMITVSVNAATVKENVDDFSSDVYIIGSTKFDSNVVVTATRAARAGLDEAKLNLALGKDISRLDVTTYYYSETFGEWYQIEDTGFEELTTEEVADLENNLDIFFVNNEEKILEFPYAGTVDEGSITAGVTYDGTKFKVPATTFSFKFTSSGVEQVVKTEKEENFDYGSFYIPYDLKNVINTQSGTFVDTYYNKYSKQTLGAEDIDDSIYYVNLGKYTGSENPTELSIGNNKYGTESKSISIGNSAFIEVPVWKIADGNILVALPWLSTDSLPVGETEIAVGGQTVKIIAYTSIADKKLTLQSVGATSTVGNHTNEITITDASKNEVTYNTGYGSHIGGLNIVDTEGNLITDPSVLIFRKDIDGNAGITKPDDGFSYSFYPFAYENSAFTKEENRVLNYKLAFIGKGVIEVTINCNKVVDPIDLKNVINTQSGTFVDTYYNKYSKQTLGAEDIDDSIYYVNLGKYTGSENPTELSIGNNTYDTESKYISIGNSAFIMVPVWKIADGNILVALPWLSTDSLPVGETEITVGGQTVKIIAYTSIADKKLTLESVGAASTVGDHTNEITITNASKNEVTYNTGYGSHIGGLNIADTEGNLITDSSVLIFRKDIDGNAGITKPDDGFSYSFYPFAYENSAFTKEENKVLNYKLAFIGKGVIEVTINCNKVVD